MPLFAGGTAAITAGVSSQWKMNVREPSPAYATNATPVDLSGTTATRSVRTPSRRNRSRMAAPKASSPTADTMPLECPNLATVSMKMPGAPLGNGPRNGPTRSSGRSRSGRMISASNSPIVQISVI